MLKVLGIIFAGVFTALFAAAAVMGVFMSMGKVPDTKAVTGMELSNGTKQELVEAGIVAEHETIEYFYSEDLFSFVDFGNLFTDKRVVSYELDYDTDEKNIYSATYIEISDIEFYKSEDVLGDSTIEVYRDGEYSFMLLVSNEEDGDEAFYNQLVQTWEASQSIESPATVIQEVQLNSRANIAEHAF